MIENLLPKNRKINLWKKYKKTKYYYGKLCVNYNLKRFENI